MYSSEALLLGPCTGSFASSESLLALAPAATPTTRSPKAATVPPTAEPVLDEAVADALGDLREPLALYSGAVERMLRRAGTLHALGSSGLLPLAEVLAACGLSRDVGERLRETKELEPIVVLHSGNPRLYVTVGAWRRFVESRKVAPPPSKSKLSKAKRSAKKKRSAA